MKKKFLSIFLALAMCLTLLPTAALAEGGSATPTGTQLTAEVLDSSYTLSSGSYYLSGNLTIEQTIKVTGEVTLDLKGHVLMMNSVTYMADKPNNGVSVIEVGSNASLTLVDSNPIPRTLSIRWKAPTSGAGIHPRRSPSPKVRSEPIPPSPAVSSPAAATTTAAASKSSRTLP